MRAFLLPRLVVLMTLCLGACGGEEQVAAPALNVLAARPVVDRYAELVHENYREVLERTRALDRAIRDLVAKPTDETLQAARKAWIHAREAYGPTEAFRFYGGPIDHPETGVEGLVNAWPMDEAYIDYVRGNESAGMINDPASFPEITAELLVGQNEKGGEENIATGWHALEFLLWGQDLDDNGPGARPCGDYADAKHAKRRATYLRIASSLLLQHLEGVTAQWAPGGTGTYGSAWRALDPVKAVTHMFTGIGMLAEDELAGERMHVAWETKDQENEHSCFSDNTLADIVGNFEGIENVYLGRFGATDGPGLDELVNGVNPELDAQINAQLDKTRAAIAAIPAPFDRSIVEDPGRARIQAAVAELHALAKLLVDAAAGLGIKLNLEPAE